MVSASDAIRAIQPGSTESGDRQVLEEGLSQALTQEEGQQGTQAGPGVVVPEDPVGALLTGEVPGDQLPTTEGLSIGPGGGPSGVSTLMQGSRAASLRSIANEAASPMLRASARAELRRMTKEGI